MKSETPRNPLLRAASSSNSFSSAETRMLICCCRRCCETGAGGFSPRSNIVAITETNASRVDRTHWSGVRPSPQTFGISSELPMNPTSRSGSSIRRYCEAMARARLRTLGSNGPSKAASPLLGADNLFDLPDIGTFHFAAVDGNGEHAAARLVEYVVRASDPLKCPAVRLQKTTHDFKALLARHVTLSVRAPSPAKASVPPIQFRPTATRLLSVPL